MGEGEARECGSLEDRLEELFREGMKPGLWITAATFSSSLFFFFVFSLVMF